MSPDPVPDQTACERRWMMRVCDNCGAGASPGAPIMCADDCRDLNPPIDVEVVPASERDRLEVEVKRLHAKLREVAAYRSGNPTPRVIAEAGLVASALRLNLAPASDEKGTDA